jgi:hypothetical protein
MSNVVTGKVAFSNLTEHEQYRGQSTNKYSLVVTLDEAEAQKLADLGVRLKDYEGVAQRKFTSQFSVQVIDLEDQPVSGELQRGSEVRLLYKLGDDHPQYGPSCYLNKVRLVSTGDFETPEEF